MYALSFRENCYSCPYANQERIADITIGDFWGLDRKSLAQRPQGSISIILLNTYKGYLLFEKAKPQLFFEERAVEGRDCRIHNFALRRCVIQIAICFENI